MHFGRSLNASPPSTLARLERYLALDPDNPLLFLQAIEAALAEHHVDRARALADSALKALPTHAGLRQRHGHVFMAEGKWAEASDVFRRLLAHHSDPDLAADLALALLHLSSPLEAKAALQPFIDRGQASPAAVTRYLRALHALDETPSALQMIDRWLPLCSTDGEVLAVASLICLDEGALDRAGELASISLSQGKWPEALLAMGAVALAQRDADRAATCFREALDKRPGEVRAHAGLGMALMLASNAEAAHAPLSFAVRAWPRNEDVLMALGWCELMRQDALAALECFRRACAEDGELGSAWGGLAVAEALQGDRESALISIAKARTLDPADAAAATAEQLLRGASWPSVAHAHTLARPPQIRGLKI